MMSALERPLVPLLARFLSADGLERMDLTSHLLSFLTFYQPTISELLWSLFPPLLHAIRTFALDYLDYWLAPLDNYVTKGTDYFLSHNLLPPVLELYHHVRHHHHTHTHNRKTERRRTIEWFLIFY
jgi:hypothetical protein